MINALNKILRKFSKNTKLDNSLKFYIWSFCSPLLLSHLRTISFPVHDFTISTCKARRYSMEFQNTYVLVKVCLLLYGIAGLMRNYLSAKFSNVKCNAIWELISTRESARGYLHRTQPRHRVQPSSCREYSKILNLKFYGNFQKYWAILKFPAKMVSPK